MHWKLQLVFLFFFVVDCTTSTKNCALSVRLSLCTGKFHRRCRWTWVFTCDEIRNLIRLRACATPSNMEKLIESGDDDSKTWNTFYTLEQVERRCRSQRNTKICHHRRHRLTESYFQPKISCWYHFPCDFIFFNQFVIFRFVHLSGTGGLSAIKAASARIKFILLSMNMLYASFIMHTCLPRRKNRSPNHHFFLCRRCYFIHYYSTLTWLIQQINEYPTNK